MVYVIAFFIINPYVVKIKNTRHIFISIVRLCFSSLINMFFLFFRSGNRSIGADVKIDKLY
jgi:hypothetical protein